MVESTKAVNQIKQQTEATVVENSGNDLVQPEFSSIKTVEIETSFESLIYNVDKLDASKNILVEPKLVVKSTPEVKIFQVKESTEAFQRKLKKINVYFMEQID